MKDKVILITGATSGIGRISAERFAEKGLTVLVHGRSKDKVTKTVSEINKNTGNRKIFGYVADLSILSEVKNLAQKIKDDYQSLDILINNAGLGPVHDSIFEVNYIATVVLSLGLEPILGQDSRVVNIASEAQSPVDLENFMKASGFEAYAQSKLAVIQFSFYLAEKLREKGISVNALDPGSFLATKMVKEAWGNDGRDINIGVNAHLKLALSESLEGLTGEFFSEGKISEAHPDAYKTGLQKQLWDKTQSFI